MKAAFILISSLFALSANAEGGKCSVTDVNSFAEEFSSSFHASSLSDLDRKFCVGGIVQIKIEHSIQEGEEKTIVRSFAELNEWLNKRKDYDGFPSPGVWPLVGCHSNLCEFGGNDANQLHNHLFLKSIGYRQGKDGAVITKIIFEDGD